MATPKPRRGGSRTGAGRPAADTVAVRFKLSTATAAMLRAQVPAMERSAFADAAIRKLLARTGEAVIRIAPPPPGR